MCEYCSTDRDGYTRLLPRKGVGNAHIRTALFVGPVIYVHGPHKTSLEIPIKYCPQCGRKLKEVTNQ